MTVIEPFINNGKVLQNNTDDNPLRHNDDKHHHQIVNLV